MAISLYETSVASYLQVLDAISGVLARGAAHADLDQDSFVNSQMRDDMLPFHFQVNSVAHHSRGAIAGVLAGKFGPPPALEKTDYASLQRLVADAAATLGDVEPAEINAFEGKPVLFKVGDFEIPFTAENFLLSFSLPNFYFHATTTYSMLRMAGVPLGKMDFLGALRGNA